MKKAGYLIFSLLFYICRLFPVDYKKAFLVMTHDASPQGNVGLVKTELEKLGIKTVALTRADESKKPLKLLRFFLFYPAQLATCGYVFMDNIFLPMAYLHFADSVKVVQLWHGTGTIKKFGQDSNTGWLKTLEKKANMRTTHLFVSSAFYKKLYAGCFAMPLQKIYATGLPRTDIFFFPDDVDALKNRMLNMYPHLKGRKRILYAPTFRDDSDETSRIASDMQYLNTHIPDNCVILLRIHPHLNGSVFDSNISGLDKIYNFSDFKDLNSLLAVSDALITDYSSIIFEYLTLKRPMAFYAYDLDKFSDQGRGFYRDYKATVPGPVFSDIYRLCSFIETFGKTDSVCSFSKEAAELFNETFEYRDGHSLERIMHTLGLLPATDCSDMEV